MLSGRGHIEGKSTQFKPWHYKSEWAANHPVWEKDETQIIPRSRLSTCPLRGMAAKACIFYISIQTLLFFFKGKTLTQKFRSAKDYTVKGPRPSSSLSTGNSLSQNRLHSPAVTSSPDLPVVKAVSVLLPLLSTEGWPMPPVGIILTLCLSGIQLETAALT
ncbi:hypothetical protein mRhiFer1_009118 [Rhinolophus ferrumequinum]|uniref:Uncharacterized protein n=1 Tax=Rhinolophus ferrumequinum TaxID=59479 RepID=A0A7J7SJ78_RHIFE|nr:hypothetical protein mRhiFer1_009118 [Rhinolophus ferrumequinum]